MESWRLAAFLAVPLALSACERPDHINLGQKADGSPRSQIWFDRRDKRDALMQQRAAAAAAQPPQVVPAALPAVPSEVLAGPVTVGLRRDGACVVAGKAVHDEEIPARLSYVRTQRVDARSEDVSVVTVLAEPQVSMDRVMAAMSAGHQAGFTKIGWQLVQSVPLPAAEPLSASAPVAAPATDALPDLGPSEAFRNWRLGIEGRDVDFSEGPPDYWYFQLFHAWLDESEQIIEASMARVLNTERIRFYGDKAATRLEQMARLLEAVAAPRAQVLSGLAADTRRQTLDAAAGKTNLELARLHLKGIQTRVNKEFPPSSVSFPQGIKLLSPDRPGEKTP